MYNRGLSFLVVLVRFVNQMNLESYLGYLVNLQQQGLQRLSAVGKGGSKSPLFCFLIENSVLNV